MGLKKLIITVSVVSLFSWVTFIFLMNGKDEIYISEFKAKNLHAKYNIFKINEGILFSVSWHIPKHVALKGKAVLTLTGESDDGSWSIQDDEVLTANYETYTKGCKFNEKIPYWVKTGSMGTATIELKLDGYGTEKADLSFLIVNNKNIPVGLPKK